jgi:hypothetical protein
MAGDAIEYRDGGVRVRVEGIGRVVRKLNKAGADAEDMRDLMHGLGEIVVDAANVPYRTGRLDNNVRSGRGKTKAVVRAGGARVPYAGVIHYGDPARGIRAQPFLTDALQSRHAQIFAALEAGINQLLARNGLT